MARLEVVDEGDACIMAGRMLRLASSLRRAAELLDRARGEPAESRNEEDLLAAFHGAPILRAQSAEIALKALWRIGHKAERDDPPRHHDLAGLHDDLTETIRQLLAERFPEIPDPTCPHSSIPYRKGLRAILTDHEAALQEWRYAYERDSLWFEHVFDEVLDALIDVAWRLYSPWLARLQEGAPEAPGQP